MDKKRDKILIGSVILKFSDYTAMDLYFLKKEEITSLFFKWLLDEIIKIKNQDKNADIVKISNSLIKKHGNEYIKFRTLINDCAIEFFNYKRKIDKERSDMIKKYKKLNYEKNHTVDKN